MSDASRTEDERAITLTGLGGREWEFDMDSEDDIYIGTTDDHCRECSGRYGYLPVDQAKRLRDWLNKVLP